MRAGGRSGGPGSTRRRPRAPRPPRPARWTGAGHRTQIAPASTAPPTNARTTGTRSSSRVPSYGGPHAGARVHAAPHLPTATPRGGPSRRRAWPRSTFAHNRAAPGHRALPARLAMASTARAGNAASSVLAAARTTSRMARRVANDEQSSDLRTLELGERAQGIRLLRRPADLLLDPPELALELRRDDVVCRRIGKHEIDHAADRPVDRHLRAALPPRVEQLEQRLAHGDLVPIPDPRPGVREQPHRKIGTRVPPPTAISASTVGAACQPRSSTGMPGSSSAARAIAACDRPASSRDPTDVASE